MLLRTKSTETEKGLNSMISKHYACSLHGQMMKSTVLQAAQKQDKLFPRPPSTVRALRAGSLEKLSPIQSGNLLEGLLR